MKNEIAESTAISRLLKLNALPLTRTRFSIFEREEQGRRDHPLRPIERRFQLNYSLVFIKNISKSWEEEGVNFNNFKKRREKRERIRERVRRDQLTEGTRI